MQEEDCDFKKELVWFKACEVKILMGHPSGDVQLIVRYTNLGLEKQD